MIFWYSRTNETLDKNFEEASMRATSQQIKGGKYFSGEISCGNQIA